MTTKHQLLFPQIIFIKNVSFRFLRFTAKNRNRTLLFHFNDDCRVPLRPPRVTGPPPPPALSASNKATRVIRIISGIIGHHVGQGYSDILLELV